MTRLESFIGRLQAQRTCLDWAAGAIADLPGPVLELGLGNGRTYDHLRARLSGRDIYCFDRQVAAHPACIPPEDRLFLGDLAETLPRAVARLGRTAALAHVDIGSGDAAATRVVADLVGRHLPNLLAPGALVASDQDLRLAGAIALPGGVAPGRYFMYRQG